MTEEQKVFAYEQAVRAAVDVATRMPDRNVLAAGDGSCSCSDVVEEVVKAAQKAAQLLNECGTGCN
ncbi:MULTISPECIES: hypothetical protein [Burkholderia]|uniref:hypothetical protein n=1 Tax=Burkholderia TaxID=32008 RepID=UPI000454FEFE|nr:MULTISPECIES: hypothetical protein [Burkholderia]AKE03031.1 hypothetical protein XM57_08800 [Burkholderia cepacia]PRE49238.1 hypothetical protein C6P87_14980 [Burkholderia sp. AU12872]AJY14623.1 hypothetical protein AK34_716 [Burkholderia dolosa AU0158]AYZ97784.1 hypothetical protein EGY28_22755 [Burkholderia dolosa]ETP66798.1 hypothetical protein BDSB_05450 [Burkholderia dolosa PC543]